MGRSRDLANLLNASGQIANAKIADDAITAAKIAADAVGASEIAAGAVTKNKLSGAGVVVNTTEYFNNTKYSISNAANFVMLSFSVPKLYSNSFLLITGVMPGRGNNSHWLGLYAEWNGVREYKGCGWSTEQTTGGANCPTVLCYNTKIVSSATGTANLNLGWSTGDGGANSPFNMLHPDRTEDGRIAANGTVGSHFIVEEILTS